jgi:hypothetical protein
MTGANAIGEVRTLMMHLSVGQRVVNLLQTSDASVNRVAIDSTHVYWADGLGAIGRLPIP